MDQPIPPSVSAAPEQSYNVARATITAALAVASLGQSLPFGASTGPTVLELNPLEIILSVLLFLLAIALVLNFFHPWNSWLYKQGIAEMAAGAVWVAIGTYELLLPNDATLTWRFGHALPAYGWAILALTTWRWIVVGNLREHKP